ncbi:MAG: DnaJ domain-containing protein [Phycisphaerae bacterium]|nr:DnaJ domain-containing protein [Phycisphaerae bacterium]
MDDPFDVLGLPARFDLDPAEVRRAWLERSAAAHPDRAPEESESTSAAARLNEARAALADPERRAIALVRRLAGAAAEEVLADRGLPEGFLRGVMDLRERLETERAEAGAAAVERMLAEAEAARRAHIVRTGELFGALGPAPSRERLLEIRRELNAWRYVERMIEQLSADQ